MLSEQETKKLDEILVKYDYDASRVIGIMQDIQREYRYLPEETLTYVSKALKISEAKIFGVATFYENFSLTEKTFLQNSKMDSDINRNNENYINALNKQIVRLQTDKKNLEEKIKGSSFKFSGGNNQLEEENLKLKEELENIKGKLMDLKNENLILLSQKGLSGDSGDGRQMFGDMAHSANSAMYSK